MIELVIERSVCDKGFKLIYLVTVLIDFWAKTENPLLPGVTKLISILFFGDINWPKFLVLLNWCYWAVAKPMGEE